jgi:putative selenium metabolism protein SsnA
MPSTLLKNATLIDIDPPRVEKADLRLVGSQIAQRGKHLRKKDGERVIDLNGKTILPGWVCAHTHLYSALSRGMPAPDPPPRNFVETLKKIWWRIDWAHNEESIYYSALVGAIEAARSGTTLLIDHHASPCVIKGSLKIIKQAVEEVGLRAVLCYEVTDRGGTAERDAGVEENAGFISAHRNHPRFRGLFGAHASFTLGNESLRACCRLAISLGSGLHIHVAEDQFDVQDARKKYAQSVIERIETFGGLNDKAVLAHGTHLVESDIRRIQEAQSWIIHNPRSNMNNAVGYAAPARFGKRVGLGTDGIGSNMFEEAQFAFFKWRDAHSSRKGSSQTRTPAPPPVKQEFNVVSLLAHNHQLASAVFGSTFGKLQAGSEADMIILDYPAPTPLTNENVTGHLLFGMGSSHVESVVVAGRFILKNRSFPHLNLPRIYHKASQLATRLWYRAF